MWPFSRKKEPEIERLEKKALSLSEQVELEVDAKKAAEQELSNVQKALKQSLSDKEREAENLRKKMKGEEDAHERKIQVLNKTIEELKLARKIAEEDIEHMLTLKAEKNELELEKFKVAETKRADHAIADAKEKHNKEMREFLKKEAEKMEARYKELLERLPNLNASLDIHHGRGRKSKANAED